MAPLLARYAECVFWLARYMERAENLARILEVQETFARDSQGGHDWSIVLSINGDGRRFHERHETPTAASVLSFYLLDRGNPTSIVSNLTAARDNARALRPLISTEMWTHLNIFYNRALALVPADAREQRLARVCALVKEGCQAHFGITAGTFYRDEAWSFHRMGAAIERADQTTRLLDAKFLSQQTRHADPGSASDISYWTALLRSAAGYQAFRRTHRREMTPEHVAEFLICDPSFPRSVAHNLAAVEAELTTLRREHHLRKAMIALEQLDALRDELDVRKVRVLMAHGELHRYDDMLQHRLMDLTDTIARGFFS